MERELLTGLIRVTHYTNMAPTSIREHSHKFVLHRIRVLTAHADTNILSTSTKKPIMTTLTTHQLQRAVALQLPLVLPSVPLSP